MSTNMRQFIVAGLLILMIRAVAATDKECLQNVASEQQQYDNTGSDTVVGERLKVVVANIFQ